MLGRSTRVLPLFAGLVAGGCSLFTSLDGLTGGSRGNSADGGKDDATTSTSDAGGCAMPAGHLASACGQSGACTTTALWSDGVDYVRGLAQDTTYLYFARQPSMSEGTGDILRVPKSGGGADTLATGENDPQGIALDDAYVYWYSGSAPGPYTLRRLSKDCAPSCGTPDTLVQSTDGRYALLTLGHEDLFAVGYNTDQRHFFDTGAGLWQSGPTWTTGPYPAGVADEGHIFEGSAAAAIVYRLPRDATAREPWVILPPDDSGSNGVTGLAVDCTHVFIGRYNGAVQRVDEADGAGLVTLHPNEAGGGSVVAIAIDDTFAYWANRGYLFRIETSGNQATPTTLLYPGVDSGYVLVDDDALYAVTAGSGGETIERIAK